MTTAKQANTTDTNSETQQLGITDNAEKKIKSDSFRWPIDDTPITYVETDGNAFLAMGNYKVYSGTIEDVKNVVEEVREINWQLLLNVIEGVIKTIQKEEK